MMYEWFIAYVGSNGQGGTVWGNAHHIGGEHLTKAEVVWLQDFLSKTAPNLVGTPCIINITRLEQKEIAHG